MTHKIILAYAYTDATGAIDEILEFDPVNGKWKEVGKMKKARYSHAVSVIEYSEVEQLCN